MLPGAPPNSRRSRPGAGAGGAPAAAGGGGPEVAAAARLVAAAAPAEWAAEPAARAQVRGDRGHRRDVRRDPFPCSRCGVAALAAQEVAPVAREGERRRLRFLHRGRRGRRRGLSFAHGRRLARPGPSPPRSRPRPPRRSPRSLSSLCAAGGGGACRRLRLLYRRWCRWGRRLGFAHRRRAIPAAIASTTAAALAAAVIIALGGGGRRRRRRLGLLRRRWEAAASGFGLRRGRWCAAFGRRHRRHVHAGRGARRPGPRRALHRPRVAAPRVPAQPR